MDGKSKLASPPLESSVLQSKTVFQPKFLAPMISASVSLPTIKIFSGATFCPGKPFSKQNSKISFSGLRKPTSPEVTYIKKLTPPRKKMK